MSRRVARKLDPAVRVSGGIALFLILAAVGLLLVGCSGWQRTTVTSLSVAHEVGVAAHDAARVACREPLRMCIEKKINPCKALLDCQAGRRIALQSLDSLQRSIDLGLSAVEVGSQPSAAKAVVAALEAAAQVCAGLAAWKVAPKVCGTLAK